MNSKNVWFDANELAGLPGMPAHPSNVTRKAKTQDWEKRNIEGKKGVSFEYNVASLPRVTQEELLKRNAITKELYQSFIANEPGTTVEYPKEPNPVFQELEQYQGVAVTGDSKLSVVSNYWLSADVALNFIEEVVNPNEAEEYLESILDRLPDSIRSLCIAKDTVSGTTLYSSVLLPETGRQRLMKEGRKLIPLNTELKLTSIDNLDEKHLVSLPIGSGKTSNFTDEVLSMVSAKQTTTDQSKDSFHQDFALIPGYSIQVSAGQGALNGDQIDPSRYLAFRRKWLKFRGFSEKDLVIVWAKGDSMEPTIHNNDTVVVHTGRTKPQDGHIYIFRNGDELFVKRYQSMLGSWRLISDNPIYAPLDIPKEEQHQFEVVGQVVHVAKDFGE